MGSKIPGAQLYLTNSEYSGERELKPYPVPPNIHGMIEGRKSASFNPWKVRCDRARPPPLCHWRRTRLAATLALSHGLSEAGRAAPTGQRGGGLVTPRAWCEQARSSGAYQA